MFVIKNVYLQLKISRYLLNQLGWYTWVKKMSEIIGPLSMMKKP